MYGQTIHYVPDIYHNGETSISTDYEIEVLLGKEILSLKGIEGFENSLMFDENGYWCGIKKVDSLFSRIS